MLMLLCAVTTMFAQTSIEVSTAENPQWYTIGSYNRGGYLTNVGIGNGVQHVGLTSGSLWYFEKANDNGGVYIVNNLKDGDSKVYLDSNLKVSGTPAVWYILSNGVNENGLSISKTNPISNYSCIDANNHNTGVGTWHPSGNDWEGTTWIFNKVTDFTTVINIADIKAAAKAEVEALAKVNVLFSDATDVCTAIDAVEATGTGLTELNAAEQAIKEFATNYKKSVNGKNIKLSNKATDGRGGRYLGYDNANTRAAAVASNGDDVIWTIKSNADGTFKLYNFVNNLYLGTPADPTPTVATEANAPSFTIIPTAENVVAVVATTGQMVHVANHTNYKLISYYSLTDAASLWNVTAIPAIVATHEQIAAATAAKESLPYAIQQAYGLVADASKYFSNYKSNAEGSYEALLDNNEATFFHSAYGDEPGDGSGVHYIQANLGDGNSVDEFYFYMKPRSGNGNNRPVNITVAGSNDNIEYTKIADVKTTLDGTMTPYVSAKLGTDGTNYQYIRLTVTSTNTSTTFFTLSELYFFDATQDVENLVNAYNGFASTSITSADYATYANALVNAETTLALANIKKEVASILAANADKYAETPALGQYTTAAYNALNAAYTAGDATQESLEAAIATFNKSKNVPVYFIRSAHNGYAAGSAIYYDGAWKWKAANKYDRQMWMTIPAYAQENVPVVDAYDSEGTSYEICDYLTGTVMRGKSVQIVKIDGLDNAYNLQYNADANSTDASQHAKDNGQLVNWKPGTANDALASAWYVDYLGTSYDLDQLTDDKITALVGLQVAYNAKAVYANAEMGEGLGQYKGNKEAIVTALTAAEVIGSKTLAQQATLNINDINVAATALNEAAALEINLPEEGKYYRIKGACEDALPGYYISCNDNPDGGRIACVEDADASTIFYYKDGKLLAYKSGLYLAVNKDNWKFSSVDGKTPASNITFAGSPRIAGAYTVLSGDRYLHYTSTNYFGDLTVQIDRCATDTDAKHDWTIEEVTELPVAVTAAGYATFYAPVAVTVPAGVTAHTVTINDEWATLSEALTVVPANTGVVLVAGEGLHNFAITTAAEFEGENALLGTVAATNVTDDAYVLGYIDTNEDDVKDEVGFYTATKNQAENTAWKNNSHKAYLPKATGMNAVSYSFRFGEGTTGIDEVKTENGEVKAIYDLTGRRVENVTAPGIYIVGGKKVLVK